MNEIIKIPKILLPQSDIDMQKWACVACDQFTSEPKYWEELNQFVKDEPSTLNMVFPEVYLGKDDDKRIESINATMKEYLNSGIYREYEGLILVKRILPNGKIRLGLMLAVDLEQYEYTEKNTALIKATEKTVIERLPARIKIRRNAPLELPHVMLLMDDPDSEILEPLYKESDSYDILYDFKLNMGGGKITGFAVPNPDEIIVKINEILGKNSISKYGVDNKIMFAVGDGNHSLATAKECWNEIAKTLSLDERINHPARYALCEMVNLYDESLEFEPIHRIIFNATHDFIVNMALRLTGEERMRVVFNDEEYLINIPVNPSDAIKDIQDYIDEYIAENPEVTEDYIHGDENLIKVAKRESGIALFMPTIAKNTLFEYSVRRGVLPRKSFSMGVAEDKRYYLEARKIK